MIKAFVFDIGNVLLEFDFPAMVGKLLANSHNSTIVDRAAVESAIDTAKEEYERGEISSETFVSQVTEAIEFAGSHDEFERTWQDIFSVNPLTESLVDTLATRYPLYLLSNTNELHLNWFGREYRVFDRFSDGIYSHLAGCMKPDPDIYRQALTRFGISASETVFIDDLAANVATAQDLGFHAFQYSIARHDDLLEWLVKLGVTFGRPSA